MTLAVARTCQMLVKEMLECNLIRQVHVKPINDFLQRRPDAGPKDLVDLLVERGLLTVFQAQQVLNGDPRDLAVWVYTIQDVIGSGSLGSVFRARSKTDQHEYALKLLPRRQVTSIPKVSRQLKGFVEFRHPAVIPIVHVGTAGDRHYLVWPYVGEGETLEALVERKGKLSPEVAVGYALQAADGLHACHEKGMFHGLLKPSDFLIKDDGSLCVLDFGIGFLLISERAESLLDTMTASNQQAKSTECGSPESLLNPSDRTPLGDQYSLGCILYYCLTGGYPFSYGNAVQKMMAHQTEEPEPIQQANPDVSDGLEAVIARLMAKAPDDRFPSMVEAMRALRGSLAGRVPPKAKPRSGVIPGNGKSPAKAANSGASRAVGERPRPAAEKPAKKEDSPFSGLMMALIVAGAVGIGGVVLWFFLH
jgi:serine/threonine protein kinase